MSDMFFVARHLASNCQPRNDREDLVRVLRKYIPVDSVGKCLHNAEWDPAVKKDDVRGLMRRYKFFLAAENQNVDDYITEKLWGSLASGTLPV